MVTQKAILLPLLIGIIATTLFCGSSSSMARFENKTVIYFDYNSPDNNAAYFDNVYAHFHGIGSPKTREEIAFYTAAIYIVSVPSSVKVYLQDEYIGKTNVGLFYFKPGAYRLRFESGNDTWTGEVTVKSGENPSVLVRKKTGE